MRTTTTDTLIEVVLDEAQRIVRAEWLRVLEAALSKYFTTDRAQMPAARPRPPRLDLLTDESGPCTGRLRNRRNYRRNSTSRR